MIRLSDAHRAAIAQQGEAHYPEECCGLLLGTFGTDGERTVSDLLPIANARESTARHHRFLIEPLEMLRAERHARALGLDVVGIYHSHPNSPAVPSQFDLDHAWPVYSYIIVSTTADGAGDLRSWTLRADRSGFGSESIEPLP